MTLVTIDQMEGSGIFAHQGRCSGTPTKRTTWPRINFDRSEVRHVTVLDGVELFVCDQCRMARVAVMHDGHVHALHGGASQAFDIIEKNIGRKLTT